MDHTVAMTGLLREPQRLPHGALTVLYEPAPGPLTAIAVAVRAGARFDGSHPGIAHLAEHMLFQGTRSHDQVGINRRAGELGGEHDADTGYEDMTLHFEVFDADVEEALDLLAEQLFHSTIPEDRFAKERRVVIDEIRGRQEDPANAVHERAWTRFFGPPLGHPICGTITSVRAITAEAVRRFVARQFVPGNMAVALVGGVPSGRIRRALARSFPSGGPDATPSPRLSRQGVAAAMRLRRQNLAQSYLVRIAGAPPDARSVLALSLAIEIVGADPDARLFQEVRERLGLGYDVGASVEHGADWAVAVISASAAREHEHRLRETVERTCREGATGFSRDELARARKKLRYRFARLAESRLDRALAHAVRAVGRQPSLAQAARLLDALELADVEQAWRLALRAPTLTALLAG
jgi:predicted Zn-dependent peptidase